MVLILEWRNWAASSKGVAPAVLPPPPQQQQRQQQNSTSLNPIFHTLHTEHVWHCMMGLQEVLLVGCPMRQHLILRPKPTTSKISATLIVNWYSILQKMSQSQD